MKNSVSRAGRVTPRTLCAAVVSIWWMALIGSVLLRAQNMVVSGSMGGRVSDSNERVVPGARVVIRNLETGLQQTETANRSGLFRFPSVLPGTYSITASSKGFRDERVLVKSQVGNTTWQEFRLEVGAGSDTVQVVGTTPLMRPTESSTSTAMDGKFIEDLPLNGRRYTDFTLLSPNTNPDGDTGLVSIAGQQGGEDSGYANGNGSSAFTVDGTNATSNYFADIVGRYRMPYLYGENAIQEFEVAISPYSAIYGGAAGFVNAVTRSGSNALHGSVFYYNRNSATGANDALSKASGYPRQQDSLQQFGVGAGGPLKRDKAWFFVDYEQQSEVDPISVINPPLAGASSNLPGYFGIPNGTMLPAPNGPLPLPGSDTAPDASNPAYLQQVANALNAIHQNLGVQRRKKDDFTITPRLDAQIGSRDNAFLSLDVNRFNSPGGVITVSPVAIYGTETLADDYVRVFTASLGWTHTFSSRMLNEFHAGTSDDNQIATPTGRSVGIPTVILDSPASFNIGNAPFSTGRVFERQWSVADRLDLVLGKHMLQLGLDSSHAWDSDNNFGGADPNADVQFGSFLGSYEFSNLQSFALGEYNVFSQSSGNPTFAFNVPYYGFYAQDSFRALPKLTLEMGLREDFQIYPQPTENPAFPLTGQYPNQFLRIAPRTGFAWQPEGDTVVRGGFGLFYTNMNGLNYRNSVVSNGLASQQSSVSATYDSGAPGKQTPTFPNILPGDSPLFAVSPDISLIAPKFRAPYILQGSLQIEREISENTTFTLGTMWNHGVHLLSGSAYDLNLNRLQGTTTYITCAPGITAAPCSGPAVRLPNMDNGLLSEGRISSKLDQINALASPAENHFNSLFVQLQHKLTEGLSLQSSYTFAKSIMLRGMDFNNQFDFSNTHAASLLDQRHRLVLAGVYSPGLDRLTHWRPGRALLEGWTLSTVSEFSSGRPFAGLLSPACTSSTLSFSNCDGANGNLNDTAFNQDTANTAAGINGAGPTPGIGLNSFYGPWLERVDLGLARSFKVTEGRELRIRAQAFNALNHANYFVQNGDGINQLQYNPIGSNCGDGATLNQTCYLVPNSGPGNFGALQEISPNGLPRVMQFSAQLKF